jgi:RsiW-degrading membrane proteinase PrsW (M82 family)
MTLATILSVVVGLVPVFLFLLALIVLDSFKLVAPGVIILATIAGVASAVTAFFMNTYLLNTLAVSETHLFRYYGPLIEELLKSAFVVYLIARGRVGFMVDGAIYGFAVGAGFAFVENLYYLDALQGESLLVWFVRGLGTAVMHGGTTAIVGIIATTMSERNRRGALVAGAAMGLAIAFAVHSGFNHFLFSPVQSTILILVLLPMIVSVVFRRSERAVQSWLGLSFDADVDMMRMINSGDFAESNVGKYLLNLREHFPGEIVADMLCLIRLHTELALKAKAVLMLREAGFPSAVDEDVPAKFDEMAYLDKSIGRTGRLALTPIFRTSSKDLWQFYMLGKK